MLYMLSYYINKLMKGESIYIYSTYTAYRNKRRIVNLKNKHRKDKGIMW